MTEEEGNEEEREEEPLHHSNVLCFVFSFEAVVDEVVDQQVEEVEAVLVPRPRRPRRHSGPA